MNRSDEKVRYGRLTLAPYRLEPRSGRIVVEGAGHMDVLLWCPGAAGIIARFLGGVEVDMRPRHALRRFEPADPQI